VISKKKTEIYALFIMLTLFNTGVFSQKILKINQFDIEKEEIQLSGNAHIIDQRLRLTDALKDQVGASWFKNKVGLVHGFEVEFTFQIWENDLIEKGGDGFTFVIQHSGTSAMGKTGDDLGYKSIPMAVVLEFDTHKDPDDKTRNQVALMEYIPASGKYYRKATVHEIPEISDGKEHFARIEYKDGRLVFFLDSYLFPVLSSQVDIQGILSSRDAWIGFTSSTGKGSSNHDIISFQLKEYLPPPAIEIEKIEVIPTREVVVKNRNLIIKVWDHNKIDGDIISLKSGNEWLLTTHTLMKEPVVVEYKLTGFKSNLILYANNVGSIPPNTATLEIDDGITKQVFKLEADLKTSQSLSITYNGTE
jgi:hypothetical protein